MTEAMLWHFGSNSIVAVLVRARVSLGLKQRTGFTSACVDIITDDEHDFKGLLSE